MVEEINMSERLSRHDALARDATVYLIILAITRWEEETGKKWDYGDWKPDTAPGYVARVELKIDGVPVSIDKFAVELFVNFDRAVDASARRQVEERLGGLLSRLEFFKGRINEVMTREFGFSSDEG